LEVAHTLQRGSIVWATIPDSRSGDPADRPCIVMDGQQDIDANRDLHVIGISTGIPPRPLPPHVFDVPSQPAGHPQTGLEEAAAAFADWAVIIPQSAIRRISGRAPARLVKQIEQWQQEYRRRLLPPTQ
jgi:hypothetical protein